MRKLKESYLYDFNGSFTFYLLNSNEAILFDTGTAATSNFLLKFLKKALNGNTLSYVILTHSHYDHCGGLPYLLEEYPELKVIASKRTAEIFKKEKAINFINEMNIKTLSSKPQKLPDYSKLKVDIIVNEKDSLKIGQHDFTFIETPGHTKCSISVIDEKEKIIFPGDSLGIIEKNGEVKPLFFSSYKQYINSIRKLKEIDNISAIAFPHNLPFEGKKAQEYLSRIEKDTKKLKSEILLRLKNGEDENEILNNYLKKNFKKENAIEQPDETFTLNLLSLIRAIKKDFFVDKNRN